MAKARRTRIFISYARSDGTPLAERLYKDLEARGLEAFLDKTGIGGGDLWSTKIEQALDQADVVLALLTPGSYSSRVCRGEQLRAFRKGKLVVPLLCHRNADRLLYLEEAQYLDFTHGYPFDRLLEAL